MPKSEDPFYNRKPVPDEFLEDVAPTGLTQADELESRERKYSVGGTDLRKFSQPKDKKTGKLDPYYARKPVPDALIHGVGDTGLSTEEEFLNRERKYSLNGSDLRKFSDAKAGFHPSDDPFYGRKAVPKAQIVGVGDTNMTKAEEFETRENKAALFDLSSDPFQQLTGSGHRASVSGIAGPAAAQPAAARRRSSAVAPDHMQAAQEAHHHSGYDGDNKLAPIASRVDDEIRPSTEGQHPTTTYTTPATTTTTTTTTSTHVNPSSGAVDPAANVAVRDNTGHHVGETGHTAFYDAATRDLDNIGPHDRV